MRRLSWRTTKKTKLETKQKMMDALREGQYQIGVDPATVCDFASISFLDLSAGYELPRKHVESKEVPWDTPLIEGEG